MRKHYSVIFKAEAVKELFKKEKTINQLAAELAVHPSLLKEWKKIAQQGQINDHDDHHPYGLYGGEPGIGSINVLHGQDAAGAAQETVLPTMISTSMQAGERLYHRMPGGGGWGDPLERAPAAVAFDVRNGKVSLAAAHERYGVVLDAQSLVVDEAATRALRGKR